MPVHAVTLAHCTVFVHCGQESCEHISPTKLEVPYNNQASPAPKATTKIASYNGKTCTEPTDDGGPVEVRTRHLELNNIMTDPQQTGAAMGDLDELLLVLRESHLLWNVAVGL